MGKKALRNLRYPPSSSQGLKYDEKRGDYRGIGSDLLRLRYCARAPFWGECKLYGCMGEHGVAHCDLCGEFPCEMFMDTFDPSHGPMSAAMRAGILAYRARHGDAKAAERARKIQH